METERLEWDINLFVLLGEQIRGPSNNKTLINNFLIMLGTFPAKFICFKMLFDYIKKRPLMPARDVEREQIYQLLPGIYNLSVSVAQKLCRSASSFEGCTVCPGSSDPPEKILNIFASENEVYTIF